MPFYGGLRLQKGSQLPPTPTKPSFWQPSHSDRILKGWASLLKIVVEFSGLSSGAEGEKD